MTGGENDGQPSIFSLLLYLLFLSFSTTQTLAARSLTSESGAKSGSTKDFSPTVRFTPQDNYLLSCGAPQAILLDDGRRFLSDPQSISFLSSTDYIKIVADNATASASSVSPLYLSARVFTEFATYKFFISKPGRHWVRLHFYPLPDSTHNLTSAKFTVNTDEIVLLRDFSLPQNKDNSTMPIVKEYLVVISSDRVGLQFTPNKGSIAFINAIELVSAPDGLIHSSAMSISSDREFTGIPNYALEVTHRLNVGGPAIQSGNDTLSREWQPDAGFLKLPQLAKTVSVSPHMVKYPSDGSVTPLDAPNLVYSTAVQMGNSDVAEPTFNITWEVPGSSEYSYLIRMHFCDIVSKTLNNLYLNIYFNEKMAVSSLDLSTLTAGLSVAYFKDFVVNASTIVNSTIYVQVGIVPGSSSVKPNAILNGLEVMKMSNSAGSLDGRYAVDGSYHGTWPPKTRTMRILAGVGLALGVITLVLLAVMCYRWRKRPANFEKRQNFSAWLLPVQANNPLPTFTSASSKGSSRNRYGSLKSKNGYAGFYASGAGRYYSFAEIQSNWL